MHGVTPILTDLVFVLAAALPIVFVFQKLRLPSIVGFLVAGILIGPDGFGVIEDTDHVQALAEIGIVMLLFVVGLELSLRQLAQLGHLILITCTIQVIGTMAVVTGAAQLAGLAFGPALIIGFLVTHSSTAIVLKLLGDRGQIDAPHGRITVGILLVQDIALVPMVLLTRVLGTPGATEWTEIAGALAKAGVAVGAIILGAQFLLPKLLAFVVRQRNREMFAGTIVLICFGTASLAAHFDLSLALGALLAGLVISESEYSHQIIADILPFRDVLNSVFFISIGMLLRPSFVAEQPWLIAALCLAVIAVKLALLLVAIYPFHGSPRIAIQTALPLATMGELAFVLAGIALPAGLIVGDHYDIIIAVAVVTMLACPFLMAASEPIAGWLQGRMGTTEPPPEAQDGPRKHVLVVGFGLNGMNLTRVLHETGLPFVVVELNPESVAASRGTGIPILYGDATRPAVLERAGVKDAAVMVIAISDPKATKRIVAIARGHCPDLPIIVRTRYVAQVDELRRLGATEVIPEEFETSIELFARVLTRLHVPRNVIDLQTKLIRSESYGKLRGVESADQSLTGIDAILARALTESYLVGEGATAAGKTIHELDLRRATGVTILAVVHDDEATPNPSAETEITTGDTLVLFGDHAALEKALDLLG